MHEKPAAQSALEAQGNAQCAVCMLQRFVPQMRSLVHGSARGLAGAPPG
jgi:hypothetical protein